MGGFATVTRAALAAFLALAVAACGSDKEKYVERRVELIYNQAVDQLQQGDYQKAAKLFDEVERQHPYSSWAVKAELMAGYSYYKAEKPDDAVIALDRFIKLHPGNRDVAYAYYLRALTHYEQISDVKRDQLETEKAMKDLEEVIRRFPDSDYARDARLKLDLTRDHLAGKDMSIGRYYMRHGYYLAAIKRFRHVVEVYQTTSQVPEALLRLVETYSALGLRDQAQRAAAVLGHNYPASEWYKDSYDLLTKNEARAESN